MSTHYIQPDGVQRLQEWGLYDEVMATNCPPIPQITFHLTAASMPTPPTPEGMPDAICPRRIRARQRSWSRRRARRARRYAKAFSVQEILIEDGAVVGHHAAAAADGATVEERARVTVGADGQHSMVARAVNAAEYDTHPAYTCGYYSYFSGVPLPTGAEAYIGDDGGRAGVSDERRPDRASGRARRTTTFHEYRGDIEGTFFRLVEAASPAFAERVRAGEARREAGSGRRRRDNFFRQPYGPGWALCGDAGYHKDFVTGLGIADAFRDAEFLSEGLHAGLSGSEPLDDALAAYQKPPRRGGEADVRHHGVAGERVDWGGVREPGGGGDAGGSGYYLI